MICPLPSLIDIFLHLSYWNSALFDKVMPSILRHLIFSWLCVRIWSSYTSLIISSLSPSWLPFLYLLSKCWCFPPYTPFKVTMSSLMLSTVINTPMPITIHVSAIYMSSKPHCLPNISIWMSQTHLNSTYSKRPQVSLSENTRVEVIQKCWGQWKLVLSMSSKNHWNKNIEEVCWRVEVTLESGMFEIKIP